MEDEGHIKKRLPGLNAIAQRDWLEYLAIEKDLSDLQHYISLEEVNDGVVGPFVKKVLMSSCSMLEQLLKREFGNQRIKSLLKEFVDQDNYKILATQIISVSLCSRELIPFGGFLGQDISLDAGELEVPTWWESYNRCKHNEEEAEAVTLKSALESLSALFVVLHGVNYSAIRGDAIKHQRSRLFSFPLYLRPADYMMQAPWFRVRELDGKYGYNG